MKKKEMLRMKREERWQSVLCKWIFPLTFILSLPSRLFRPKFQGILQQILFKVMDEQFKVALMLLSYVTWTWERVCV